MGSIFGAQTKRAPTNIHTRRQVNYLKNKKTDRKVIKHEQNLQIDMCDWLRLILPAGVHFRSDTASGAFNSEYEKQTHNRQQSSDKQPDLVIFAARRGWHSLQIELKTEDISLRMRRDGTKIRFRRDRKGKIIERDYKIRKKGDWASLHIERQHQVHEELKAEGHYAAFACGEREFKNLVRWYFDMPPEPENTELF